MAFLLTSFTERVHLWVAARRKFRREIRNLRRVAITGSIQEVRFYLYDAAKSEDMRIW